MDAEQAAAVERLRKHRAAVDRNGPGEMHSPYFHCDGARFDDRYRDERIIVDAYLAEHPSDDSVAVDEKWLRSVGFAYMPDKEFTDAWGNPQILAYFQRTQVITVGDEGPAVSVKTRGDVRRLCRALGIELKPV